MKPRRNTPWTGAHDTRLGRIKALQMADALKADLEMAAEGLRNAVYMKSTDPEAVISYHQSALERLFDVVLQLNEKIQPAPGGNPDFRKPL
jgi:hypothetical protein